MKVCSLLTIICLPFFITAQEKKVESGISDVTIFNNGAQLSRSAEISVSKGINILAFTDISPKLDEKSIQFQANGNITVLSFKYETRYDENTTAGKEEAANLNNRLGDLRDQIKQRKDLLAISVNEEEVLIKNTDFNSWEGMNMTQLQQGVDLVRSRLTEVKQRKQNLRNEIDKLNEDLQKTVNKLQEIRIESARPKGVVVVKLEAENTETLEAKISYVVADAGWKPYYDLRVEDISKPLQIEYKAKVYQNTGEDWEDVNLTLSTGDPYQEGALPELNPWFLNYISGDYYRQQRKQQDHKTPGLTGNFRGLVTDAKTGEAIPFANVVALDHRNSMINGTTTDIDGSFQLNVNSPVSSIEVSYIGYEKYKQRLLISPEFYDIKLSRLEIAEDEIILSEIEDMEVITLRGLAISADPNIRGARGKGKGYYIDGLKIRGSISRNPVNLNFEVERPYDISSDGEEYKVMITEYEKEVDYRYRAVPKLNEHAFLTASFTDWEGMNLMNGSAGIYYEGTYLGETELNVEEAGDTLEISLGKDENIVVQRNAVIEKEGSRFFSNRKEERFHYELKVRNNKAAPITLEIIDQFPLSANEDIRIERIESSDGKVDNKTGAVVWELTLMPKEEKILNLIYNISYPKGSRVNVR